MSTVGTESLPDDDESVAGHANNQPKVEDMSIGEDEGSCAKRTDDKIRESVNKPSTVDPGKGVTLSDIRHGYGLWGPPPLPPVHPSSSHTVLYKIPWRPGQMPDPYPVVACDRWDQEHVRMPHSSESLYPVQESEDEKGLRMRWELVQEALLRNILSSHQLESAILSYNSRYNERWNFTALHSLFNEILEKEETDYFFKEILPIMAMLALQLPDLITGPLPLLRKHKNHSISLTQVQIGAILANAFFCTFPRRNSTKKGSEYAAYPDINFNRLFQSGDVDSNSVQEKLKCILNYFRRICVRAPDGVVTFSRRFIPPESLPNWNKSSKPLPKMHITSSGYIEDEGAGMLQVDFANKYVGGGVLGWGCVQEEIRFVICPELIVSRLFTECLDATEALIVVGCERFSKYKGYGHTFEWIGDFDDNSPQDIYGRRHCSIVAMDALYFSNASSQFTISNLTREVNKAFVGFCESVDRDGNTLAPVATGNWGCGAFRGDAHLKALIQLIAAGETGRSLVYFTFGDVNLRDRIYRVYRFLVDNSICVGKLWSLLCEYSRTLSATNSSDVPDLYEYIYSHALRATESKVSDVKPLVPTKRKGSSTPAKPKPSSSSCDTRSSRSNAQTSSKKVDGTELNDVDPDLLIEEFDSDNEKMDDTEEAKGGKEESEFAKPSQPSNSSCLTLIEESLQEDKVTSKKSNLHLKTKDFQKPTLTPLEKDEVEKPQVDLASSATPEVMDTTSVLDSTDNGKSEDMVNRELTPSEPLGTQRQASSTEVARSLSNLKRNSASKRKISDYFSPV